MRKFLNTEDWGHSIYTAYLDLEGDPTGLVEQVTGVAAVCFDEDNKVVLMNYEPLGGHLEKDETIELALKREVLEEGGVALDKWKYFGFYEIKLKADATEEYKNKYPMLGYILFFLAKGKKVMEPYGKDVKTTQQLSKEEVLSSNKIKHKMLVAGVKLFPDYLND